MCSECSLQQPVLSFKAGWMENFFGSGKTSWEENVGKPECKAAVMGRVLLEIFQITETLKTHFSVVSDAKNMYRNWISWSLIVKINLVQNFPVTQWTVKLTMFVELNPDFDIHRIFSYLICMEEKSRICPSTGCNRTVGKPLNVEASEEWGDEERGVRKIFYFLNGKEQIKSRR